MPIFAKKFFGKFWQTMPKNSKNEIRGFKRGVLGDFPLTRCGLCTQSTCLANQQSITF